MQRGSLPDVALVDRVGCFPPSTSCPLSRTRAGTIQIRIDQKSNKNSPKCTKSIFVQLPCFCIQIFPLSTCWNHSPITRNVFSQLNLINCVLSQRFPFKMFKALLPATSLSARYGIGRGRQEDFSRNISQNATGSHFEIGPKLKHCISESVQNYFEKVHINKTG